MTHGGFCFVGCGGMTAHHIRHLRSLRPRARIAVASRDRERARAFAREHRADEALASYDDALRSAYETVIVATPPRSHRALVEGAVEAGKNVLVEKPIFSTLDEFESMWPLLCRARGVVMVAENDHFAPFHRMLKSRLAALDRRAVGRPLFLDLVRLGASRPTGWRADEREMPLGALHEGGVHWIRRLLDLASVFEDGVVEHVTDVSAFGPERPLGSTPHEDTTMVVARHRSGLTSRLLHSWAIPWRFPSFDVSRVILEGGALYFDARGTFAVEYRGSERRLVGPALRDRGGFLAMWAHFLSCIDRGVRPELTLSHTFSDFAFLDAALRAKASRTPFAPRAVPATRK